MDNLDGLTAYLFQSLLGRGLDLGMGVRQGLAQDGYNSRQAGGELLGGQVGHGAQQLNAALLRPPGTVVHAL